MTDNRCWNCGRKSWICSLEHFWGPMISGAIQGLLFGGFIGAMLALVVNLVRWANS